MARSINHIVLKRDILAHDQWYFFLAQVLGRVAFVDEVLTDYRQHGANSVGAVQKRPTVGSSLWRRIEHYGIKDELSSDAAAARAQIARELAARLPDQADHLNSIADRYDLLAARLGRRAAVYRDRRSWRRLRHLIVSRRAGDYGGWPWGFDRRSIVRDLVSGVLLRSYEQAEPKPRKRR